MMPQHMMPQQMPQQMPQHMMPQHMPQQIHQQNNSGMANSIDAIKSLASLGGNIPRIA
jgi:hypothetical protein